MTIRVDPHPSSVNHLPSREDPGEVETGEGVQGSPIELARYFPTTRNPFPEGLIAP